MKVISTIRQTSQNCTPCEFLPNGCVIQLKLSGLVHDLDVWIAFVPEFIEEERQRIRAYFGHEEPLKTLLPGLNAFTESRKIMREDAYDEFLRVWDAQSEAKFWERIKKLIATPINLENAMPSITSDLEPKETK
jgi:hypothetical protein